jgi:hypothetical protein
MDDDGRDKFVIGCLAFILALVIIGFVMLVRGH